MQQQCNLDGGVEVQYRVNATRKDYRFSGTVTLRDLLFFFHIWDSSMHHRTLIAGRVQKYWIQIVIASL